jgi:hypothetical protein
VLQEAQALGDSGRKDRRLAGSGFAEGHARARRWQYPPSVEVIDTREYEKD